MAFRSSKRENDGKKNIESLFRDLSTSGVESLYAHQADVLRIYESKASSEKDVAIELPTGSGKTLIGLLIAEFKRRQSKSKVVYLCPTRQLVHQVVEMANKNYGINAISFVGSKKEYPKSDKTKYNNAEAIAVTTYSSLFNVNPFFYDPEFIIIDDAHASENYISTNWSLRVVREEHDDLYLNIIEFLSDYIPRNVYIRMLDEGIDPLDKRTIYLVPIYAIHNQLVELGTLISSFIEEYDLRYQWSLLKDNLHACNIFYSWGEILIRPIIPPSLTNSAFNNATQRIFMSATLGNGGDLERITGIAKIYRIGLPDGWDRHSLGRRFFVFPSLELEEEESMAFMRDAIKSTPRSVLLVSSNRDVDQFHDLFNDWELAHKFYTANDIEDSKDEFLLEEKAVAVLANRFDGIDFPGDDCRLLIVKNIPYHANIQERYLQSRVDASIIFYDRNRTRLIQAIGRCTRSPKDFAAVIVAGENDLTDWLFFESKHKYFHPELQAELKFGFNNSRMSKVEMLENLGHFFAQDSIWANANETIIEDRDKISVSEIEGITNLDNSVRHEIKYLYALWNGDYEQALERCDKVIEKLDGGPKLKGYRAFWSFLKSNVCFLLYKDTSEKQYYDLAVSTSSRAARISSAFRTMKLTEEAEEFDFEYSENFESNIDRLIEYLDTLGISNKAKFRRYIDGVVSMVSKKENLERAQVEIGKLLGFESFKDESSGAPDPIWISNDQLVFVFEDKLYDDKDKAIPLIDIRQAVTHEKWLKENHRTINLDSKVYPVFMSNSKKIESNAKFACDGLNYWNYENFKTWALEFLLFIGNLQSKYASKTDLTWREYVLKEFKNKNYTPEEVLGKQVPLSNLI
ncbi:DEAD/DEAH box helicase [Gilvibacter sp.]|uniref:DEAD/DEAH box helicase n=1 Tax=Gilvibacter sp. TaxID=2729997 RepID=UPI003F4A1307